MNRHLSLIVRRTWVVVADLDLARIFLTYGPAERIQDLGTLGAAGFGDELAVSAPEPDRDKRAVRFARRVASALREARRFDRFDNLVLVADPQMLGLIRAALDDETKRRVRGSLPRNLSALGSRAIARHLHAVLPAPARASV